MQKSLKRERLVRSLKRCLKKTIGRAKLFYDELVTVVTEAEMILNCRPISYVSSEDLEEPLTPAHLIIGQRISAIPEVNSLPSGSGVEQQLEESG